MRYGPGERSGEVVADKASATSFTCISSPTNNGAHTPTEHRRSTLSRSALVLLPLLAFMTGQAQERVLLRGRVWDAATDRPLTDVHIVVLGTKLGAESKADGGFELDLVHARSLHLRASRVGYTTVDRVIGREAVLEGEYQEFRLMQRTVDLPEITIGGPVPEVVHQREDLHVGDHFANQDGLWVLTYERPKLVHRADEAGKQVYREARLHLLGADLVERSSIELPTEVCRSRHDAVHRVIVEGTGAAWLATATSEAIELTTIDLSVLREQVLPWTDSLPGQFLGNDHDPTFPAFAHFGFDLAAQRTDTICTVQDDFRMELFRSQYKYMSGHDKVVAMDLALETGIDAGIIAGYMTDFHRNLYFKAPYAPLFVVQDTLCVFDHYRERIRRFLPDRTAVDEVPLTYHLDRTWKDRLVQDRTDGAVYALFARGPRTWLRRIETVTGALGPILRLEHPYPEEVQAHDGQAYYIFRPYGSQQRRTLYRQAIG